MIKLVLFDIDRTLMSAGGAGGRAIRHSLQRFYGRGNVVDNYIYDGKTDPQIFVDLLSRFKAETEINQQEIANLLDSYIELLPQELAQNTAYLYPGVKPLLSALKDEKMPFGLLTGNIERGAKLKLSNVGIWHEFRFGAFGNDNIDRNALPPIALQRAEQTLGQFFKPEQALVVGDAVADVECAKKNGLKMLAVASGRTNPKQLDAAGADVVFRGLDSAEPVPQLLEIIRKL